MSRDYELFSTDTECITHGLQTRAAQRMLDFDYVCGRERPSVACFVDPTRSTWQKLFWGTEGILVPVYRTLEEATQRHPAADVVINFASSRSAGSVTMDALAQPSIRTVVVIAEGVPEREARVMTADAHERGKWVIGPATVGGLVAGAFKIGNTGGTVENIVETKLYRPGSVGFVSKSGGMSNECYNLISRNSDGIYEGIAIGGDRFPGSTLLDHLLRYEANPEIKMMVCLGEIGGRDEYAIVNALREGRITKPLVAWVTGTCASILPGQLQFGHAGAQAQTEAETAEAKNEALRDAGAVVPSTFNDLGRRIADTFEVLKRTGAVTEREEPKVPAIPMDYGFALNHGLVRRTPNFVSTIADDRGEEVTYGGVPISDVIESDSLVGHVVGLLWFKKPLPAAAAEYLELCLKLVADHGPAVSGAHNTIVTARAGRDLVSALTSGLLTIGPRFGGAINDCARYIREAHDEGVPPAKFVADMKARGTLIPGIGHRVKSVENPDVRVELLKRFAKERFAATPYLDYALEVERITTAKRGNLILNVDGCIGVTFLDFMTDSGLFSEEEIDEVLDIGYLNALFVLGRSIGLIGHALDQYRLKQGLYRHPWDDILYMTPEPPAST